MHEADLKEVYPDFEERSVKVSIYKNSCQLSNSDTDSVQQLFIQDTKELIHDLKMKEFYNDARSFYDANECLADSIDLECNSSFEILDSTSDNGDYHRPAGIMVAPL